MAVLCGVCSAEPSKYKCPTCQLPYCSVHCYKPHKATHAGETSNAPSSVSPSASALTTIESKNLTLRPPERLEYSVLVEQLSLQKLFTQYPRLVSDIRHIYSATKESSQARSSRNDSRHQGKDKNRGVSKYSKDQDSYALRRLKWLKSAEGSRGEGFREFAAVVLNFTASRTNLDLGS